MGDEEVRKSNSSKQKYKFNQIKPIKLQSKRKLQKTEKAIEQINDDIKLDVNEIYKHEQVNHSDSSLVKKTSPNESSVLLYGQNNKPSKISLKRNPKIQQTSSINSPSGLKQVQNNSNLSNISSFNGSPLRILPNQNTFMHNDFLEIDSIGKKETIEESPSQLGQRQLKVSRSLSSMNRISQEKVLEEEKTSENTSHLINAMFENIPQSNKQALKIEEEHSIDLESTKNAKKLQQLAFIKQMKEDFGSDFLDSSNNSTELTEIKVSEPVEEEPNDEDESDSSDDDELFDMMQQTLAKRENKILPASHNNRSLNIKEDEESIDNYTIDKEVIKEKLKYTDFQKDTNGINPHMFLRLLILKVIKDTDDIGTIILKCCNSKEEIYTVILNDIWIQESEDMETYNEHEIIHITSLLQNHNNNEPTEDMKTLLFNKTIYLKKNDSLFIITSPDILISGTTLADAVTCQRQTVIKRNFGLLSQPSIVLNRGIIIHELFQKVVRKLITVESFTIKEENMEEMNPNLMYQKIMSLFHQGYLIDLLKKIVAKHKYDIVISDEVELDEFIESLQTQFLPIIETFIFEFLCQDTDAKIVNIQNHSSMKLKMKDVLKIEEPIDSSIFGIKGIIDMTIKTNLGYMPLEIKTGKFPSLKHATQTLIYALLLWEKYNVQIDFFWIIYLGDMDNSGKDLGGYSKIKNILNKVDFEEFKRMINFRNNLIKFFDNEYLLEAKDYEKDVEDVLKLPGMLTSGKSTCERQCCCQDVCTVVNRLERLGKPEFADANQQSGDGEEKLSIDSNVLLSGDYVNSLLSTISKKDLQFFLKYFKALQVEDKENELDVNGYFLQSSISKSNAIGMMSLITIKNFTKLNKVGTQIIDIIKQTNKVDINDNENEEELENDDKFEMTFKFNTEKIKESNGLNVFDSCILSDEIGHFRLDYVTISDINYSTGVIKILGTQDITKKLDNTVVDTENTKVLYRLDLAKYDMPNKIAKYNLVSLFEKQNQQLKNLIVNPEYNLNDDDIRVFNSFDTSMANWNYLNPDQSLALKKALSCDKYSLIRGMPGTGKTQVITELIHALVSNNKKILITSFTHSAVDNMILKLFENDKIDLTMFKILRIGSNLASINPKNHKFTVPYKVQEGTIQNHNDLKTIIDECNIVATTCLSANNYLIHDKLANGKFDYCILDEATQVNLPVSLKPLEWCKKFVLVGDDKQLSPLVKSKKAFSLKESLFTKLSKLDPKNVTNLTIQYRMNQDIMELSNFLVYDNLLKCGDFNKNRLLPRYELNGFDKASLEHKVLDNEQSVLFIDYSKMENFKNRYEDVIIKNSLVNLGEIDIIKKVIEIYENRIPKDGYDDFDLVKDTGILSIYRGQLNEAVYELNVKSKNKFEILTADQFQGRDKKLIVISFVKSRFKTNEDNDKLDEDSILNDLERINVSLTRSKCKLILIGNSDSLLRIPVMNKFINGFLLKNKSKYVHEMY